MTTAKSVLVAAAVIFVSACVCGCAVRTYTTEQPRSDLDLAAGNRGFVGGKTPATLPAEVKETTRTIRVTEIELPGFLKAKSKQPAAAEAVDQSSAVVIESTPVASEPVVTYQPYTVVSGDNLEKIAKKFYGKPTQWKRIFEANKDILKSPDKLRVGQVLQIPLEPGQQAAAEALPAHAK